MRVTITFPSSCRRYEGDIVLGALFCLATGEKIGLGGPAQLLRSVGGTTPGFRPLGVFWLGSTPLQMPDLQRAGASRVFPLASIIDACARCDGGGAVQPAPRTRACSHSSSRPIASIDGAGR